MPRPKNPRMGHLGQTLRLPASGDARARYRSVVRLTLATAVSLALLAVPQAAAGGTVACGSSPADNGTGYRPPSNRSSLPPATAGPAILHAPLASTPQLENAGPWRAEPIMISGARSYRDGEFVYQDFLYDDRALTYPDEPERYAGNAADLVEVRIKPLARSLGIRLTYNSMLDVDAVAATIALGDSNTALELPHGAGAVAPGEVFVTVHGCGGDIVRAADGETLAQRPTVVTDLRRRQIHVEVPYSAFDPRRKRNVRIAAAAGLWDTGTGRYLRPDPQRPAFFNVAFRTPGPWVKNTWMDESQNIALAAGDLSSLYATVDFTKLKVGTDDDLVDQPGGVPSSGPMNRILVSHFEPTQGRGNSAGGGITGDFRCDPPQCTPQFSGRLQPYTVYVPATPRPADGYGFVVNLHGADSNHNHFETGPPNPPLQTWRMFAEQGRPSIMVLPNARGMTYWYHGLAAADVFEVWADIAARYDLAPGYVVQTGSSMGGFGTYKLGVQFPDLYNGIFPNVGINTASLSVPPLVSPAGRGGDAWRMFANLRHVPVLATSGTTDPVVSIQNTSFSMETLDQLGYRYDYWWFGGVDAAGHAEYRHYVPDQFAALMARQGPVDRNPRRVTYVLNAAMHEPQYGIDADHAYWLSGLTLRDEASTFGTIDVVSHGFPTGDSAALGQEQSAGATKAGSLPYERVTRDWGPAPPAEPRNVLDVTATNLSAVTIDVDRARVTCDARVNVKTDGPLKVTLRGDRCNRTVNAEQ
ncbi:hypothetical protein [Nocardioides vastitatis]|uniref:Peptidase n=1 Tax=Nocardioides vastitatis TaxID=2568655 RepID=A0ABW0ZH35_9ACTN